MTNIIGDFGEGEHYWFNGKALCDNVNGKIVTIGGHMNDDIKNVKCPRCLELYKGLR